MRQKNSCQTCKDRKVKCDGSMPVCQNCLRSKRKCHRKAFSLSWPRDQDRRAILGLDSRQTQTERIQHHHFINTGFTQVEACSSSRISGRNGNFVAIGDSSTPYQSWIHLSPSSLFSHIEAIESGGGIHASYFHQEAFKALPQFDADPSPLKELLLRMSVSDSSPSSKAVLYSIFSLSCIHRYGNVRETFHFKDLALKALQEISTAELAQEHQALQHVAANLLLCRVESLLGSEASTFWGLYVCSTKTILNHLYNSTHNDVAQHVNMDAVTLYKQTRYHEAVVLFSLRHWRRRNALNEMVKIEFKGRKLLFRCTYVSSVRSLEEHIPSHIKLLAEALDQSLVPDREGYSTTQHQENLDNLEAKILQANKEARDACKLLLETHGEPQVRSSTSEIELRLLGNRYLFTAAIWIYFQRTSRRVSGPSSKLDRVLQETYNMLLQLPACAFPLPLLLIGSEASTEERRRVILDVIHRAQDELSTDDGAGAAGSLTGQVAGLLEALWVQDDLHDDSEGYQDYVTKMHRLITAREVLPALV